jgi:hypothetical protein
MPAQQMRSERPSSGTEGARFVSAAAVRLRVQIPRKIVPAAAIPTWIALVIALAISGAAYGQKFCHAGGPLSATPPSIKQQRDALQWH